MSQDEQQAFERWLGEGKTALLSIHSNPMMMRQDVATRAFAAGIAYKEVEAVKAIETERHREFAEKTPDGEDYFSGVASACNNIELRITGE